MFCSRNQRTELEQSDCFPGVEVGSVALGVEGKGSRIRKLQLCVQFDAKAFPSVPLSVFGDVCRDGLCA